MRKVNEFVEMLKEGTRNQLRDQIKKDEDAYKNLLKDLLI